MLKKHTNNKLALFVGVVLSVLVCSISQAPSAGALSASDWQAGNIMSDNIFFNSSAANAAQIQNFLNAKVPNCDTYGTQLYSGATTRAQYGASQGYPAPYTCLKNYTQSTPSMAAEAGLCGNYSGGSKSSAQLIFDVSQACGVNPGVLLTLLQKEQSLVTDDWPFPKQYTSATGFGCPDTAPCDSAYGGFFFQVYYAARQFRQYQKNAANYNYRMGRSNTIRYNPIDTCGSSSVYIQNQATAGLYAYTPYQPNSAALANLYGSGDSCSAYGNRNFWRLFSDWFGPTTDNDSYFTLTDTNPDNGLNMWYLITPTGRYYIPTGEIYNTWGLNKYSFQTVSQSYFNSVPDRGTLGRTLKDKYNNYFFVDDGKIHYARELKYLGLWGLSASTAVQSTGLVYALPSGDWLGRFARDATTGSTWVMDGGKKHTLPATGAMAYQWGLVPDQVMSTTSSYLDSLTDTGTATQFVASGSSRFVIDRGSIYYFGDVDTQHAFTNQVPTDIFDINTLSYLPIYKASVFVQEMGSGNWYMLEGGRKHYIPNASLARDWGYSPEKPVLPFTKEYLATFSDGGTLSRIVQTQAPIAQKWAVDGTKHLMPDANTVAAWVGGMALPTYSTQSLNLVSRGADATTLIRPQGSSYVYTLDNGVKRYLPLPVVENAWGSERVNTMVVGRGLADSIIEASSISVVIRNNGTHYLLMNGTAYPINPAYASSWRADDSAPVVADSTLARFSVSSSDLGGYIKVKGTYYIMNNLYATPVTKYGDAYPINESNATELPYNYFATSSPASFLVRSSDGNDLRIWLINQGKKTLLPSFAQQANYGYISSGIAVTVLSPAVLSSIADSSDLPSLLVTKSGAGVKQLSFGYALGFPDGVTLTNYVSSTNPITTLSPSIYDQFTLRRYVTRLVKDDAGNVYYMENGTKRLINNRGLLQTTYAGIPQTYLEGTTIVSIPTGSVIN